MEIRKAKYGWKRLLLRSIAWTLYLARPIQSPLITRKTQKKAHPRIALFVSMELLGGGVMISGIAKVLKYAYPNAKVYVVGEQHRSGRLESFYKTHSCVDDLIICPVRGNSTFGQWWRFYRKLREYKFDVCVLSPNHSCANTVFLYLCGIPEIVGVYLPEIWPWHKEIENRFCTRRLTSEEMNSARLWSFPEAYGKLFTRKKDFRMTELGPFVRFKDEELPQTTNGPRVVIHPGGLPHKRWQSDKFAEIATRLVEKYNATLFIIGGPEEQELAEAVKQQVASKSPGAQIYNCSGCSLNRTMNYIAKSNLYIGNNAGTVQIAVALGTPVVGIYAEADQWYGPDAVSQDHSIICRSNVEDVSVREMWESIEKRCGNCNWAEPAAARGISG
jgi:ADP-heptose:LPS heptosyltransferase